MQLEALAATVTPEQASAIEVPSLPLVKDASGLWQTDWTPLIPLLLDAHTPPPQRAYLFHACIADNILQTARLMRDMHGDFALGLTGGVFQNRLLTEMCSHLLSKHSFRYYIPETIPVNDGGLCFGQVIEAHALSIYDALSSRHFVTGR